jgi:hypothetical protein
LAIHAGRRYDTDGWPVGNVTIRQFLAATAPDPSLQRHHLQGTKDQRAIHCRTDFLANDI